MKTVSFVIASLTASALFAVEPTVSDISIQQRWPWNQLVDIDYTLDCDDSADVSVTLYDGETRLDVPIMAFSGDVTDVTSGRRRIVFDPIAAGLAAATYSSVRAELTARPTALYLIIDLTKTKGEPGVVTYVTKADLESGAYGSVATNPVSGVTSIAWTGVTNDAQYATTKYVMRRVTAGTFMMGANNNAYSDAKSYNLRTNTVTLSHSFYIGVFETTQSQWERVMGSNPSYFKTNGSTRPVEGITYAQVRGSSATWPTDGYGKADEGTFLQKMCDLTGLTFDLPTFAQWQYASGQTLTTWYNTGRTPSATNWQSGPEAAECARYYSNGGNVPTGGDYSDYDIDQGTACVGSYRCNALGLYDMHGNVWEFLLDYYDGDYAYPEICTDPVGPSSGSSRMWNGGSFWRNGQYLRLAFRGGYSIPLESTNETYKRESGFRAIVMP